MAFQAIAAPSASANRARLESPDAAIIAAWERWQTAHAAYDALPYADEGCDHTPEEAAQWAIIDAEEAVIQSATATTPEGVAIQLWLALYHSQTDRETCAAIMRRDLAGLEAEAIGFDWGARLIFAALRSLQAQGAAL